MPVQECLAQNILQKAGQILDLYSMAASKIDSAIDVTHRDRDKLWTGFQPHNRECRLCCVLRLGLGFWSFSGRGDIVCCDFQLYIVVFASCVDADGMTWSTF